MANACVTPSFTHNAGHLPLQTLQNHVQNTVCSGKVRSAYIARRVNYLQLCSLSSRLRGTALTLPILQAKRRSSTLRQVAARSAKGASPKEKEPGVPSSSQGKPPTSTSNRVLPATKTEQQLAAGEEEEYEDETWLEEKLGDAQEFTSSVMQAVPGPRVASSEVPWLVAVPAAYLGITFVWSIVRVIQKYNAPKAKRRRQIGKNAMVCEAIDEFLPAKRDALTSKELSELGRKHGFSTGDVVRKYVRYALNERPFDPELVADLIHLRRVSGLSDEQVAEELNEVSRRIVKAKGPIVMDTTGMTEKGIKRKAAVQALFTKLYYLAGAEEFCSSAVHDKLELKVIFGITDEDAESIKIETLSDAGDVSALENMMRSEPRQDQEESEGEETEAD